MLTCLTHLLDQAENDNHCRSPVENEQPFLREFNLESGEQPKLMLYFDQTLTDIERFCCQVSRFSPLAADTTFNIGEYLFTQTTYKNLSLIRKDTGGHPWFPGQC